MPPLSPRLGSPAHLRTPSRPAPARVQSTSGNALSQLQPTQVRTLRDAFQILDRDSDGVVNREDVADMLGQLGLPTTPSDLAAFFPPDEAPTMTLAVFLNSIAASLALMSPSAELLSALSAFDDDDSGQVDLGELREALLHTPPEADIGGGAAPPPLTPAEVNKIVRDFSGRRAFSKHAVAATSGTGGGGAAARRGEVFRYRDFVNSIVGGGGSAEANANGHAEEE
ncbi:hypothetical protein SLS62_007389 [Diatrype stigma]|uniref:EF-hand domain-containing protein n=1 Tax=Diatrype stigma TaxID=117547 RepID=A0AAN9UWU7_9PEZI